MDWKPEGATFPVASPGDPDSLRALRPWVLEDDDALRMWYTGDDGTTTRILSATRRPGRAWERHGVALDAGFAGDTDAYGVEAPCVVTTPGGYAMAYAGFDGEVSRLHMATSGDGRRWSAHGPIMQRGAEDAVAATHPCLLITGERWWLYFAGYDGSRNNRRSVLLAATSSTGASWDRLGAVLEPAEGELAVSHPCVLEIAGMLHMLYASDDGDTVSIVLATSKDGLDWDRRGITLAPAEHGPGGTSVHAPCAVRLRDGSLHLWYCGLSAGDTALGYRIYSATVPFLSAS